MDSRDEEMNHREKKKMSEHFDCNLEGLVSRAWVKMSGTAQDIYKKGKSAATEQYRAILRMVDAQDEENEKKHKEEVDKYSISDQMKLLDGIMQKGVSYFNIKEEKDRLEAELLLAESWMAKP
ncbi:hypothetical protein Bca4012_025250 [Brassica carinata]